MDGATARAQKAIDRLTAFEAQREALKTAVTEANAALALAISQQEWVKGMPVDGEQPTAD